LDTTTTHTKIVADGGEQQKKWNRELLDKKNKMTASGFVTSF
jgi:hypothetical protein